MIKKMVFLGLFLVLISGCVQEKDYSLQERCVLSSCDCNCYIKGTEPYEGGIECGNDCREWKNIYGCEFKDNKCVTIIEKLS
jgi:hypothetical protein